MRVKRNALIVGLLVSWQALLPAAAATSDFSFVQLCDPQLGMTDYKDDICSLEQAVKQIDLLRPQFALVCGDLCDGPSERNLSDFRKIVESLTVQAHDLPGNHDLTPWALKRYRELFGKDTYAFTQGGFRFVVMNTQYLKMPMEDEANSMMAWVKGELEGTRTTGAVPIMVGHHPPFFRTPDETEVWQGLPVERRKALLALCKQYHVRAYLSGHTHCLVEHRYGDTEILSGETTSTNTDGRPLGFRLWRVRDSRLQPSTFIPLYRRKRIEPKPPYDPAAETGSAATCLANLRLLDAAKEALGMQRGLPNGREIPFEDVLAAIKGGKSAIVCPDGGEYRMNALGQDPECSHPGHRLPYFHQFEEFQKRCKELGPMKERMHTGKSD